MRQLALNIVYHVFKINIREIILGLDIRNEEDEERLFWAVDQEVRIRLGYEFLPSYVYDFLNDYIVEVDQFSQADYDQLAKWYLKYLCIHEYLREKIETLNKNNHYEFVALKKQFNVRESSPMLVSSEILHKFFIKFSYELRINKISFTSFTLSEITTSLYSYNLLKTPTIQVRSCEPNDKEQKNEPMDIDSQEGSLSDNGFFKTNKSNPEPMNPGSSYSFH